MRHTFVSIESGVLTDSQLKMLVGHSKNMDTAGVYRHELDGPEGRSCYRYHRGIQKGTGLTLVTVLVTLFFVNVAKHMGYKPTQLPFQQVFRRVVDMLLTSLNHFLLFDPHYPH